MSFDLVQLLPELRGEVATRLPSVLAYAFTCMMMYEDVEIQRLLPSQSIPKQWRAQLASTSDWRVARTVQLAVRHGFRYGELRPAGGDFGDVDATGPGIWVHFSRDSSYAFIWTDDSYAENGHDSFDVWEYEETRLHGPCAVRWFSSVEGDYQQTFRYGYVHRYEDWINRMLTLVDCVHCRDMRH